MEIGRETLLQRLQAAETRVEDRRARAIGYAIACLVAIGALFQVAILDQIALISRNHRPFAFAVGSAFILYWGSVVIGLAGNTIALSRADGDAKGKLRDRQVVYLSMALVSGTFAALSIAFVMSETQGDPDYPILWQLLGAMVLAVLLGWITIRKLPLLGWMIFSASAFLPFMFLSQAGYLASLPRPIPTSQMVQAVGPTLLVLVLIHIILVLPDLWIGKRLEKIRKVQLGIRRGTLALEQAEQDFAAWEERDLVDRMALKLPANQKVPKE